ncbi:MAG: lipoprotein-releasing ABC transporter permease subunit [Candidatus Kapaibacteriales bacterium]
MISSSKYISARLSNGENGSSTFRFSSRIAKIAIAIGVMALSLSLSILDGFEEKLRVSSSYFTGDISVLSDNGEISSDINSIKNRLSSYLLDSLGYQSSIYPKLSTFGFLNLENEEGLKDYIILGLEVEEIKKVAPHYFNTSISAFENDGFSGVLLSSQMIEKENIAEGDSLLCYIYSTGSSLTPTFSSKVPVTGYFSSGLGKYDKSIVITEINWLRENLGLDKDAGNGLSIWLDNNLSQSIYDDRGIGHEITLKLNDQLEYPFYPMTVSDLNYEEFVWIQVQKAPIPIALGLISVVAAFTVLTAMLINVIEKRKHFGVLRVFGLGKPQLVKIIITNALSYCLKGLFYGLLISITLLLVQKLTGIITLDPDIYFVDTVPVKITLYKHLIIVSVTVLLSLVSSILPLALILRQSPIESIRYE